MARARQGLVPLSGTIGDQVYYRRFGKTFVRRLPKEFNDRRSEGQLRQRALFKAMLGMSALLGSALQRGLTKEAHGRGHTEANEFVRMNKSRFVYEEGKVSVDYASLELSYGSLAVVAITGCKKRGRKVKVTFRTDGCVGAKGSGDVVHFYAVEPAVGVCELVASVDRDEGVAEFELPDLGEEAEGVKRFHLYAMAEKASTAKMPTLSAEEKMCNKKHRNINRTVSRTVYVGMVEVK